MIYSINDITKDKLKDLIQKNIIAYEEYRKERYQYIPSGLDIETTTTYEKDDKGKVIKHFSFIYHWQFSINDNVIVGRDLDSLIEFIIMYDSLQEYNTIVFIQNQSFEFSFISKELVKHSNIDLIARNKRKPLYFKFNNITFLDSYQITGFSLEKIAENYKLNVKKLVGGLNYELCRNSLTIIKDDEMDYNCNDVLVLSEYSKYYYKEYFSKGFMPITRTMIARHVMKEVIDELECQKDITNLMMEIYPKSQSQYDYIMSFFTGAFTHGLLKILGEVKENGLHFDEKSEYPSVMVFEYYPVSEFRIARKCDYLHYLKTKCCLIDITLKNIKTKTGVTIISKNKVISSKNCVWDNGRLYKGDEVRVHITELDLKAFMLHYDFEFEINTMLYAKQGHLPRYIINTIIKLYILKESLKNVDGKEIEYMESKKHLNSQYGSMCTKLNLIDLVFNENGWEEVEKEIDFKKERFKKNLAPQWSVYVTAHARYSILYVISKLKGFWYSDTDSFFCEDNTHNRKFIEKYNKSLIERHLNTMKELNIVCDDVDLSLMGTFTEEPKPLRFKTLGAKRYIQEYEKKGDVLFESTISGLPKHALKEYCDKHHLNPFEVFEDDMNLNDMWSGKLCAYYCDDEVVESITDYQGNTCVMKANGYVSLIPTTFNLSLDKDLKVLMNIERG